MPRTRSSSSNQESREECQDGFGLLLEIAWMDPSRIARHDRVTPHDTAGPRERPRCGKSADARGDAERELPGER